MEYCCSAIMNSLQYGRSKGFSQIKDDTAFARQTVFDHLRQPLVNQLIEDRAILNEEAERRVGSYGVLLYI